MKRTCTAFMLFLCISSSWGQLPPVITSWLINTTGATGYNGIPSNVQSIYYTSTDVYVTCTCIPGYNIGPWGCGNPNTPADQNFAFKITRNPVQNSGAPVNTPLGHTGVWSNGVSIFNAKDGMSYNNQGNWNRNAYFWEGCSFDACLGHPAPNGEYHHHVTPDCLYDHTNGAVHSPIIGYAFDGFPIYGAYGYVNTNGTGGIKRMVSSYQLYTYTTRTNGPPVNSTYPLGCFVEDYYYSAGTGDLDQHNGRFCVTPEYPSGIYAYFVTLNASLSPAYPFTPGPSYYGTVQAGNTGPGSGHNAIPGNATLYTPPPLAVELIAFRATPASGQVELEWKTASEHHSDYFTIERSADALTWTRILREKAKGNQTTGTTTYTALDETPLPGIGFYRLSETDTEGKSMYSEIVQVNMKHGTMPNQAFPNPFKEIFYIQAEAYPCSFELYDLAGRLILDGTAEGQTSIPGANIPAGTYLLKMYSPEGILWHPQLLVRER
jgi:hypothetical protein